MIWRQEAIGHVICSRSVRAAELYEGFGWSRVVAALTRVRPPMISDEQFWSLIDQARAGGSASASPERLSEILSRLSDDEILQFGRIFYEKICDLNHWRLWAAGYVIAGGMSDDSFHYFRCWIVGKGKQAFEAAMKQPEAMNAIRLGKRCLGCHNMWVSDSNPGGPTILF